MRTDSAATVNAKRDGSARSGALHSHYFGCSDAHVCGSRQQPDRHQQPSSSDLAQKLMASCLLELKIYLGRSKLSLGSPALMARFCDRRRMLSGGRNPLELCHVRLELCIFCGRESADATAMLLYRPGESSQTIPRSVPLAAMGLYCSTSTQRGSVQRLELHGLWRRPAAATGQYWSGLRT